MLRGGPSIASGAVNVSAKRALAVYAVNDGTLTDTGARIGLPGGPASIRSQPR